MNWSEHVFPHGEITELKPGLYQVSGSLGRSPLPRNMVIAVLPSGGLWIHSAIALDESGMEALEALGAPEVMVVPNALHRADAGVYKERYPGLRVLCPQAAIAAVSTVVPVDGSCEEEENQSGIIAHEVPGIGGAEVVFEVPVGDEQHALVMNDLLFNLPHQSGPAGWILRYVTSSTGGLKCTRVGRWVLRWDLKKVAAFLSQRAAAPGLVVLTVAHGDAVVDNVSGALRATAEAL